MAWLHAVSGRARPTEKLRADTDPLRRRLGWNRRRRWPTGSDGSAASPLLMRPCGTRGIEQLHELRLRQPALLPSHVDNGATLGQRRAGDARRS